jgi:glycosyltransferase involved in cell wall biosynthesis
LIYEHPKIVQRLMKTRLALFAHDYVQVFGGSCVPASFLEAARQFKPDVIMTGAETWMADMAAGLACKLKVPLVGHFMDWPTFAMMGHSWVKRHASEKFRRRYQRCDLAFGICPEMLETLGAHRNAHVFYPSGQAGGARAPKSRQMQGYPFTILFAGNLGQWYGRMLESLASHFRREKDVRLQIAGSNALWTAEVEKSLRQEGTHLGFLKGAEYKAAFDNADALLLIMGFGTASRLIESTSFKSKLADYLTSGLPLVVWGPDYCTAIRHARREDFAEVVTTDDPVAVVTAVKALARNPSRSAKLVENGFKYWEKNLDANKVMPQALEAIRAVVMDKHC